jgi:preprotein translocase subunit SecB|tara:strand:+ start:4871 stop:5359 length:489 start_codon:yes stop_codon:yes gene_type:complete
MSEQDSDADDDTGSAQFALQRIYIKDLSFESPRSPQAFKQQWQPQINLELNSGNTRIDENLFEVVLSLTITAKNEEEDVIFLAELQQAGIFHIQGLAEEPLQQTLGSFCPNVLFPYARETIDSLVTKGSFPPLMLAPVNFDAIYAETMKRKAQQAEQQPIAH